jgi:hypothetical protein
MKLFIVRISIAAAVLLIVLVKATFAQEEPLCVENSPERRGEIGCSIVEIKPLPSDLKEPLFWHIDRFQTGARARAAVGPASIAFEAHGAWWLMSVESESITQENMSRRSSYHRYQRPPNIPCW